MKAIPFKSVQFLKSAVHPKDYPVLENRGQPWPEVAIAGRSNVGKSSLLNNLFGQKQNLARTSATPGKTQLLNFYQVDNRLICVDLPGYGYAKVPQQVRTQWGPMIQSYLEQRSALQLILFLFDIRRLPNEDDLLFVDWVVKAGKAMILVLTKIDKLSSSQCANQTQRILKTFNLHNLHYVHYSVPKQVGRRELIAMLGDALLGE